MTANQNGKAMATVTDMCAVAVNVKGNKPKTLLTIIKVNLDKIRIITSGVLLTTTLNSDKMYEFIFCIIVVVRLSLSQKDKGRIKITIRIVNQFKDIEEEVEGSKILNKLVIIIISNRLNL